MLANKKIAVVYRSGSGFTKEYATWLSQELHCELLPGKTTKVSDLLKYDTIIYGGGLYAIGINGFDLIKKNYEQLKCKELIVFAVGASPVREATIQAVRDVNIPEEMRSHIQFYYLRGGFNYKKLSPLNKVLMQIKKIQLKKMKNSDADAKGMLESYDHPLDFTNKKNLRPILESLGQSYE
ncbi:MAG: flavodoxin [Herbinix sp.]|jgi:menaquinone-dependent protoporphyrinogen IX oxidase|nr:flavodoxin [Herbinix sp.]